MLWTFLLPSIRVVALNGNPLSLGNNEEIPALHPVEQDPDKTIQLPGLSFGYIVFKDSSVKACI